MSSDAAAARTIRSKWSASAGPARSRFARWFAWDAARDAVREFRLHWLTITTGAKVRYALPLGIGFVLCCILTAGVTFLARWAAPRGLDAWDARVLRAVDAQRLMSVQNAILLESFGNLAYLIPLVAACALVAIRRRRPLLAVTFVVSYVLARPIVGLGWLLWDRARPRIILDGRAAPPLHSYPSGHVMLSIAVYGVLAYLWVRASKSWLERATAVILALAIVFVTGFARLRLGTHWPSDIIAGWIIGCAWLAVVLRALHRSREGS
jgi:membrane-associated phospholipid phosphatase